MTEIQILSTISNEIYKRRIYDVKYLSETEILAMLLEELESDITVQEYAKKVTHRIRVYKGIELKSANVEPLYTYLNTIGKSS